MGSKFSKNVASDDSDNNNLMKLDSISTVSMALSVDEQGFAKKPSNQQQHQPNKLTVLDQSTNDKNNNHHHHHNHHQDDYLKKSSKIDPSKLADQQRQSMIPTHTYSQYSQERLLVTKYDCCCCCNPPHHQPPSSFRTDSNNNHNHNHNNTVNSRKRLKNSSFGNKTTAPDTVIMDMDHDDALMVGSDPGNNRQAGRKPIVVENNNNNNNNHNNKNQPRNSCSIVLVFLLEILGIILLSVVAILLRYSNLLEPVKLNPQGQDICRNALLEYTYPKLNSTNYAVHDSTSLILVDMSDDALYYVLLASPIALIILFELFRFISQQFLDHRDKQKHHQIYIKDLKMTVSILPRRLFRIAGGFILGFLACDVLITFLKLQLGQYRPYTLSLCPEFCKNIAANCTKTEEFDVARQSFPSLTAGLSTYCALFLILHLMSTMNYRVFRTLRLLITALLAMFAFILTYSRVILHHNHVGDVVAGTVIGVLLALYMAIVQLNCFANKLSDTNLFSISRRSDRRCCHDETDDDEDQAGVGGWRDQWFLKNFHIPRVQARSAEPESRNGVWHSDLSTNRFEAGDGLSRTPSHFLRKKPTTTVNHHGRTNAYINPAFHDNSLDGNHSNNNLVERNNSQKRQMRTFRS